MHGETLKNLRGKKQQKRKVKAALLLLNAREQKQRIQVWWVKLKVFIYRDTTCIYLYHFKYKLLKSARCPWEERTIVVTFFLEVILVWYFHFTCTSAFFKRKLVFCSILKSSRISTYNCKPVFPLLSITLKSTGVNGHRRCLYILDQFLIIFSSRWTYCTVWQRRGRSCHSGTTGTTKENKVNTIWN